ncbi:hypothetical protein Nepgr_003866 [Nepenthes gracilis]|uniref:Uncharacterized protein n=1 Tax=Nepenthes gracilis TaxID=150966 RepID=A0AAD3S0D9_NEPGR|nr:hypothetical protein Nepgr_003866 [Nepenthes gracilis]
MEEQPSHADLTTQANRLEMEKASQHRQLQELLFISKVQQQKFAAYNTPLAKRDSNEVTQTRNLESQMTLILLTMDKPNGFQQNAPGNVCQSDGVMSSEVPGEMECNQVDFVLEKQSVKSCEQVPCL